MAASLLSNSPITLQKPAFPPKPFSTSITSPALSVNLPRNGVCSRAMSGGNVCRLKALGADNLKLNDAVERKKSPIVVIDNYDSFTYNLCQYMGEVGCDFEVYRNDELTVEELRKMNPRGVLISPRPGAPKDSGISLQTVLEFGPIVPLFGVCMELQCIGEAFGGRVVRAPYGVMHGKSSPVFYDEKGEEGLFTDYPFTVGRYHSLVIERETFPSDELEITAWTEDGLIMAARHKKYRHLQGVQFHPESITTTEGKTIVRNFVKMIEKREAEDAHN